MLGIQRREDVFALTKERAHFFPVVETLDAPFLVTREEAVVGNNDRQPHVRVLTDLDGRKVQVVDGLRIPRHQDDPARVQDEVNVRMVTTDIQRPGDGAGRDVEHHRHACSRPEPAIAPARTAGPATR